MTEVSPMPEAKPKSPLPGNYEEYETRANNVAPTVQTAVRAYRTKSNTKMSSDNQGTNFSPTGAKDVGPHQNPSMNHKENVFKTPETVHGDNPERQTSAPGQANNAPRGAENKGKETFDSTGGSTATENSEPEEHKTGDDKASHEVPKPMQERYKMPPEARPRVEGQPPGSENQKFGPDSGPPKPAQNAPQNAQAPTSYRPTGMDGAYNKPPPPSSMHNTQMKQAPNHVTQNMSSQPMRKPDGSPGGYQQSYQSQPRQSSMYQMPSSTSYSTSPYQPSTPSQYSSPQLKGDISRSNYQYQNSTPMTAPNPAQRSYPQNQSYADLSSVQQRAGVPRPHMTQPILNRPQMYQTNPSQRILPDGYQKSPNMQPVRAGFTNQNLPPSNPIPTSQYYNPVSSMRTTPLTPSMGPTVGMSSTLGDSSLRMYKTDANLVDASKLKTQTPLGSTTIDPRSNYVPSSSLITDQNRTMHLIRPSYTPDPMTSYQKKPETEEAKQNPETTLESKPEKRAEGETAGKPEGETASTDKTGENKEKKEEKEPGIVLTNVKFFEERDKAKVPLTPNMASPVKPAPPSRSATFISGNVIKGESFGDEEYESGVDETPLLHPNLRNVGRPLDLYGRGGRSRDRSLPGRSHHNKPKFDVNSSCPGTPVKVTHSSAKGMQRPASKSHRSIFEFSPEEELLYFFNIAKATYHTCFDRNHDVSRIDDAPRRKETMPTANGDVHAVKKTPTRLPAPAKRSSSASSPTKTPLKSPGVPKSLPKTPDSPAPLTPAIKKVPMNKIQVGAAPSPNLKAVKSKIGSLANTTHKPGGGNIKIESHKVDFSKAQPRIEAKNDTYAPGGGDKKIQQVKLQWSAKPKVGSLENAAHKPGGGDKKIESVKLDFKDKAKPKVGSKDNVKHVPGGGAVKIESQKLEFKVQSKVGSLDNVKHKPGGGDVKIFDDKTYLKQISCGSSEGRASGTQSYCDLSIVSEVHSISAPGTPHHGTAIKIKKSTTLARSKPEIRRTTEVTVMSRSPSIERKNLAKSPSTHEVRLTYAKVASPKHKQPVLDNVGPVEIVKVPVNENSAVYKPGPYDETPVEVKNLISSFEQQITNNKGLLFGSDGKNYPKTKTEPMQERKVSNQVSEELNQKFMPVKEELDRITQDKTLKNEESSSKAEEDESMASKFLKNEMAAHEKVGEMWKEVHSIGLDKPNPPKQSQPEESVPPPPPPTPSVTQKPGFQSQPPQIPSQQPRPQSPRAPFPQQNPGAQRFANPQQQGNMQRPPHLQMAQRPQYPQNTLQMRPPLGAQGQRQPYPELGSGPMQYQPRSPISPRNSMADASDFQMTSPSGPQQPLSPSSPFPRPNLPSHHQS